MRAAAILGPGNLARSVASFQRLTGAEWTSLIEQADAAVIFGGDGTVHRHLAELVELEIPVLVVPCGSGNDFARALGIRSIHDAVAAWQSFANGGSAREIDLGIISSLPITEGQKAFEKGPVAGTAEGVPFPANSHSPFLDLAKKETLGVGSPSDRLQTQKDGSVALEVLPFPSSAGLPHPVALQKHFFCCAADVGMNTAIARRASMLPQWLRSHGGYALSALREFTGAAPFPMKIDIDGADSTFVSAFAATVANASVYGGGMKIAPRAQLDDGKLDLCIIREMNLFKLFGLFPTVYFGRHLGLKEVGYQQFERACIETERPLEVFADGEYVCQTPVTFGLARNALQVVVPR